MCDFVCIFVVFGGCATCFPCSGYPKTGKVNVITILCPWIGRGETGGGRTRCLDQHPRRLLRYTVPLFSSSVSAAVTLAAGAGLQFAVTLHFEPWDARQQPSGLIVVQLFCAADGVRVQPCSRRQRNLSAQSSYVFHADARAAAFLRGTPCCCTPRCKWLHSSSKEGTTSHHTPGIDCTACSGDSDWIHDGTVKSSTIAGLINRGKPC